MKFAIVIPVFNKELFLREAIESVLNQTYNKGKCLEVILVNDGSTDKSEIICKEYLCKYPSQFKYTYTDNKGPSAARNCGISLVSKEVDMVGFLDADDYLDKHVLEQVQIFLSNTNVEMLTLPVRYFNSKGLGSDHSLNYRFIQGDRVFNVHKQYKAIHFYTGGLFIKRQCLLENFPFFEEGLYFWEDAYSINRYLLKQPKYGAVTGAYYYYRRHENNNNSMVDGYWKKKERYTDLINNGYNKLIKQSIFLHGRVLPFIQYLIVFHIKLYLFNNNYMKMKEILTESELREFKDAFRDVLENIDEYYIKEQSMKTHYKSFLLSLKRDGWPMQFRLIDELPSEEKVIVKNKKLTIKGLKIRGYLSEEHYLMSPKDEIYLISGDKKIICVKDLKSVKNKVNSIWDFSIQRNVGIEFEVIVPFHLLNFTYYLKSGPKIIMLNSFNYYKRIIHKITLN